MIEFWQEFEKKYGPDLPKEPGRLTDGRNLAAILAIVRYYKPAKIAELYTAYGDTAVGMAKVSPESRVWAFDIPDGPLIPGHAVGNAMSWVPKSVADRITLQVKAGAAIYASVLEHGPYGLTFVDGGHNWAEIAGDTALALETIEDDGLIIWDDYCPREPDVMSFIKLLNKGSDDRIVVIDETRIAYVKLDPELRRKLINLTEELGGRVRRSTGRFAPLPDRAPDLWMTKELISRLEPGECFWDLGACEGEVFLPVRRHLGPKGFGVAVEPNPVIAAQLFDYIPNDLPSVVLPFAGGASPKAVRPVGLLGDPRRLEMWDEKLPKDGGVHLGVAVLTLEFVAQDLGLRMPHAIKIDVEGYELEILRGMGYLLDDTRTVIIELEDHHQEKRGLTVEGVRDLLRDEGFVFRKRDGVNDLWVKA